MMSLFGKRLFLLCNVFAILVLVSCLVFQCAPQKKSVWDTLFNGKNLDGWSVPEKGEWKVTNGEISASWNIEEAGSAWMMADSTYEDFVLRLQFLVNEKGRGGVCFRVPSDASGLPDETGYKVQIDFNDENNPTGSLCGLAPAHKSRGKYTLAGETMFERKDDWNDMEISAVGEHILVRINGHKVVERFDRKSLKGRIGLQIKDAGSVIRFKNILIRKKAAKRPLGQTLEERLMSEPGEFVKVFNGKNLEGLKVLWGGDWKALNGVIHGGIEEGMGWLITEKSYSDFIYRIKVKITPGGNSGLTVRFPWPVNPNNLLWDAASKNDDLNPAFGGYEIQILNYDPPGVTNPSGSIYDVARAYPEKLKKGVWNQYEVYAEGPHMAVYMNGEKVSETVHTRSLSGGVGMQVHVIKSEIENVKEHDIEPYKVMFKDIEIKEIK
ncbi:DUF1080 domain-containing protein [candidate division KSB1 bacterium]